MSDFWITFTNLVLWLFIDLLNIACFIYKYISNPNFISYYFWEDWERLHTKEWKYIKEGMALWVQLQNKTKYKCSKSHSNLDKKSCAITILFQVISKLQSIRWRSLVIGKNSVGQEHLPHTFCPYDRIYNISSPLDIWKANVRTITIIKIRVKTS